MCRSGVRINAITRRHDNDAATGGIGFFLRAEAGIRDFAVTGVQTCALPISGTPSIRSAMWSMARCSISKADMPPTYEGVPRSEERRVGKDCRSSWPPVSYESNYVYVPFSLTLCVYFDFNTYDGLHDVASYSC